ncbi:DUF397 domain-containing protein [Plantactinospora sp. WMMB782]|uniref:DUF397 domain-containing protein n=1 Tax=Plantactinospora sp. WMMB782 TaxID=3404121 RepID=UPI003B9645E5
MSKFSNTSDPRFRRWVKGSTSGGSDGCLFVASAEDGSGDVAIADSKAGPAAAVQVFNRREWAVFLAGAKAGEFDHI